MQGQPVSGAFSRVARAVDELGRDVAVKTARWRAPCRRRAARRLTRAVACAQVLRSTRSLLDRQQAPDAAADAAREGALLRTAQHVNVVRLLDAPAPAGATLALEWCDASLEQVRRGAREKPPARRAR